MATAQASLIHCEQTSWTARLAATFGLRSRRRVFDFRDLPDHLKRDVGYLDGNSPCSRRK
ncbi:MULTISPECIES: hypothetical protein [Hyphomicrobiales]|jgi:hypothetical protein|uniref:hypothetical protein n=1 Tax=Hyphomicrobiales TaxID=356 RepID=UPI00037E45D2|nr:MULTISPECIES: hypothetical protein [Phyllobacteriaceae]MCX8572355.1 hypothetical protein [Aminobacter sp. MET-1]